MGTPPSPQHQSMTDIPRLRSSSEEMAKGKQCWLLPAHSNLKEAGNLAFLEAQVPQQQICFHQILFTKEYCPVPRPLVPREPASAVLTISLCLHLMSALPKLRVGKQAGRFLVPDPSSRPCSPASAHASPVSATS